jgi:hypothetical protein
MLEGLRASVDRPQLEYVDVVICNVPLSYAYMYCTNSSHSVNSRMA